MAVSLKNPRSCKNCVLLEGNKCILSYPTERDETFPFIPYPLERCYKVTTTKDYMTVIRNIDVYRKI